VPFDVIFLHLALPPSWEMMYLPHRVRKLFVMWWGYAVKKLGLVSLIFGMDVRPKPSSRASQMGWLVADAVCQFIFGKYDNRATRARVPASDRVELATLAERRREGVFIPLDSKGAPRTEADKIRLLKQDRAARKAGRNPKDDYTVVTLPDFWRTRVYALLAFMLFSAACVTAGLIFVPLAIGRQVTAFWFDEVVYDGYSWVGFPPDDADLPDYRHLLVSDLVQHGAERQEAHH
jgi:E3 ubiquitin-protein ligase MARCH6